MSSSVARMQSMPMNVESPPASPLESLVEEEEMAFVGGCIREVTKENRLGFEAKYGLGKHPSIRRASADTAVPRQSLYNQSNRELKKIKEKLLVSGLV